MSTRCDQATSWLLSPAWELERLAFNPSQNLAHKDAVARVAAVAAPALFLYQIPVHGLIGVVELATACCGCTSGMLAAQGLTSAADSAACVVSSLLEIPQKMVQGSRSSPNYFSIAGRYQSFIWYPSNS